MQILKLAANLLFQPTDTSPPASVPISINSAFTQKGGFDISEAATTSPTAVPMGTITKPIALYVEVYAGTLNVATDVGMLHPVSVSVDAVPAPTDKACLLMYSPAPGSQAFWVSSPGPVSARIWVFG